MGSPLIGALRVSLTAETAQFEAGMKRAQRTAAQTRSSFQKSFGGLAGIVKGGLAGAVSGLSVGLLLQGTKAALEYAGSLGEVAQQLGVTTKDLQVFRYAAGQTGVSQEQLETGLSKLTITLGKVAAGAKAPIAALNAIGVSVDQLKGKDTGEAFRIIADGLEKVKDRSQRAAVEVALFGRSGAQLDNLLAGGSAAVNELARAAEELGIVLSDEQIQNADRTADKLDALQTVLKAKIAADVADNANSILDFADALFKLVNAAIQAREALANFERNFSLPSLVGGKAFGENVAGRSVTVQLRRVDDRKPAPRASGGNIGQFLGGGGRSRRSGGGSGDAERKREQALRDAYQFDQDLRRAQMDTLRAQQGLATDYTARANIAIELLNLEQQGYERELEYQVASGEISKAQAASLKSEYEKANALERIAVRADEEAQRYEDYNRLDQLDFELQRDILQSQEQLATTAAQQRDIRLRLLDLDYRAERARLETILADEKASYAAKEEARRRMAALEKTKGNDEQAARDGTMDPLEAYFSRIPKNADEMNEALNGVAARGLQSLEDGLVDVLTGTEKVGAAFKKMAQSIIADLIRIQVQQMILKLAQSFGIPQAGGMSNGGPVGYAGGGWVSGPGTATSDSIPAMLSNGEFVVNAKSTKQFFPLLENINSGRFAALAIGGLAMPRMSHGARVNIGNDNMRGGSPVSISFAISGPVTRETQMQIAAATRRGVAQANRKGM